MTNYQNDAALYFHELSHAMHDRIKPLKDGQDPLQEILAEMSAAVLISADINSRVITTSSITQIKWLARTL